VGAELAQKCGAIALDSRSGIVFGEAKVERAAAVSARDSSQPRGKSVDEPSNPAQVASVKNADFGLILLRNSLGNLLRHLTMLPEASSRR